MKGILVISHGDMAKGMIQSSTLFFGKDVTQLDYVCFQEADNILDLQEEIGKKIKQLDTGEGVLILADLFAGTPAHKTSLFLRENVQVICGMNFPMFLELLAMRLANATIKVEELLQTGKDGIQLWDPSSNQETPEFFD